MVVPYAAPADAALQPLPPVPAVQPRPGPQQPAAGRGPGDATPAQQHFLRLLQDADADRKAGLAGFVQLQALVQRTAKAEQDVAQLRQLFQDWQLMLLQQQTKQLQVCDALVRQQIAQDAQQQRVQEQLAALFRLHGEQHATTNQHLGKLQLRLLSMERAQRADRRQQDVQRQLPTSSQQLELVPEPYTRCPDDDCCPCELPEQCPLNPCYVDYERPLPEDGRDCLLRGIRLGFIHNPSPYDSKIKSWRLKRQRRVSDCLEESENGYMADDEASLTSETSSLDSSFFPEERRKHLQEIRSLKNASMEPRYKQIWQPLRCFQCGSSDHLATFCHFQTTSL